MYEGIILYILVWYVHDMWYTYTYYTWYIVVHVEYMYNL